MLRVEQPFLDAHNMPVKAMDWTLSCPRELGLCREPGPLPPRPVLTLMSIWTVSDIASHLWGA